MWCGVCVPSECWTPTCGSSMTATSTVSDVVSCLHVVWCVCSIRMLDPDMWEQYDRYKLAYSNILYNWRLFNQRAVILKFITASIPQHKGVGKLSPSSLPAQGCW